MANKIKFSDGWAKRYSELLDMFGLVGLSSTCNDVKYYTFGTNDLNSSCCWEIKLGARNV